ncbi:hypothetical protein [Niabella beijingensis]|uniref:hypothetical protein n=1 Tax=Niabella beijingensis TaxID=2872700 RepID=UPI001CBA74E4|nr:hypothetical protein [Niabella beijingensis]MBZ4192620.1 hypothetical protein [Niabella beijingensis]
MKPTTHMLLLSFLVSSFALPMCANAQCGSGGLGCPGTNYANYGVNATGAATIEYDNFVSGFHTSTARETTGELKIWGARSKYDGSGNLLTPTAINGINFPGLTGTPLKVTLGGNYTTAPQTILLTTDGLWAWGAVAQVVNTGVKNTAAFGKIALGLPPGVSPLDIKMLFGTYQNLAITTCSGDVWVLTTYNASMRGDGASGFTSWARVTKADGSNLTGVVATRGGYGAFFALTNTGELYTWGQRTYLGDGTAQVTRNRATLMTPPSTSDGPIKMIGVANDYTSGVSYYVLYENGKLFSMGYNAHRQLGDFTTTIRTSWVRPQYAVGNPMDDILWISPNEHDPNYAAINVINKQNHQIFCWGEQNGGMLGRTDGSLNPGQPADLATSNIEGVETGGHTTLVVNACRSSFGYAGHKIYGSMGDGTNASYYTSNYSFESNLLSLCGLATQAPKINVSGSPSINDNGEICVGTSVVLSPTPAGGTLSITSGGAYVTLTDNVLHFTAATPANTPVVVSYTVSTPSCGTVTESRRFLSAVCTPTVTIPGSIWNDANGNAVQGPGETGMSNDMWANLVGPDGKVITSIKINDDGTFELVISKSLLTASGGYSLILTNTPQTQGAILASADIPANGYGYTGVNRGSGSTADPSNRTGIVNLGDLSAAADNSTTSIVNIGISNDPAVLPVVFGTIGAKWTGNSLKVTWTTENENYNDHFDIEASINGVDFISVGTVKSAAQDGNSDKTIQYEFTKDMTGNTLASILGIGMLTLGSIGVFRKRKLRLPFTLVIMCGLTAILFSCRKSKSDELAGNGEVFIKVTQVDKDGSRSSSKVVKVVKE